MSQDDSTQFSGKMVDQRGTLKQILQNGVTPFTNMRKANIVLGKSVVPRKRGPLYGVVGQHGNMNLPFAYRFHTDLSNQRASALLLFRHNKEGRPFISRNITRSNSLTYTLSNGEEWHFDVSDFTQNYNSQTLTVSISASDLTGSNAYALPTGTGTYKYINGKLHDGESNATHDVTVDGVTSTVNSNRVWTFTFPANWTFNGSEHSPWPYDFRRHEYGYDNGVKVFPRQYQYSPTGVSTEDRGAIGVYTDFVDSSGAHLNSPFESVSPGTPKVYYAGMNRSDLEDVSLQLNPMLLYRQGEVTDSAFLNEGRSVLVGDTGILQAPQDSARGFTNIRFGHVMFNGKHQHNNESLLAKLNKLDDDPLPRTDNYQTPSVSSYAGALGTSFKYDAVLKRGGCRFLCVNRGGSGCNVDVHVFKLKKKHVGEVVTWENLVKPYTDAYIKRYYEIITADDFKGRDPNPEDVWNNPKFPLLPGSRHVNAEDQFLSRIATHSYYIPSQGRKSVNLAFPGERYDPADFVKVVDGVDTYPEQDEFTYFCLLSTSGEKSNAMFSSKGELGTLTVSLSDVYSGGITQAVNFADYVYVSTLGGDPALPTRYPFFYEWFDYAIVGSSLPQAYTDWFTYNRYWQYYATESLFLTDEFISRNSYDVTNWFTDTYHAWGPYTYTGKKISRNTRIPLPTYQQWLDASYDTAVAEQGYSWTPAIPLVTIKTTDGIMFDYGSVRKTITDVEYPKYVSIPAADPRDPPVDVSPAFDPDVLVSSVRTNLFFLFFSRST
jgi:hypothetical protein